ncbi:MAG: carbohydrate kinase family protein [Eubacteriales bacterium]
MDIVSLGELLIDYTPAGISETGMNLLEQNPGGAPANVLAVASHMGLKTAFIGKVGNDMQGVFLREVLEKEGIDTKGLIFDNDSFTTLAFVGLNELGERTFSFARKPGADTLLTVSELNDELLKNCRILHIGSLSLTNEPARSATFEAVKKAKSSGAIISYDPNYRAPLWPNEEEAIKGMQSMLSFVDIMKVSDEEIELITGEKDIEKAVQLLLNKGLSAVAVTLGSNGAYMSTKDVNVRVPGFNSKVVDTTGAGDAFWGGALTQFLRLSKKIKHLNEDDLQHMVRYGNAVASLCVEKRGGIPAIPYQDEVNRRLANNFDN